LALHRAYAAPHCLSGRLLTEVGEVPQHDDGALLLRQPTQGSDHRLMLRNLGG
jgi:hypothetical protein